MTDPGPGSTGPGPTDPGAAADARAPGVVTLLPLTGIPEVHEGDDLADVVGLGLTHAGVRLRDGDVLVVSSKIASKSLGLVTDDTDKDRVVREQSRRVVAERAVGDRVTRVVEATAGPVMAAAGVDGSNTGDRGGWLLLPHDPDEVCARLCASLRARHGVAVGVVLSDTAGRPWRVGQVDFALGAHGLHVLDDLRGATDADGRPLEVTSRAVADEVAAAADLVKGKVAAVPAAVVRGLRGVVLPDAATDAATDAAGGRTAGGRDLVRTGPGDWFALGRVEAVRAALGVQPGSPESAAVGIAPVAPDTRIGAVSRAVRLAVHDREGATADVGPDTVTLGADTAYDLGALVTRLQAALWCERLVGDPATPAADGLSVVVGVTEQA
ncbi:coenzyme F420-0:L-glutamate ligase [Terrabacter aeriphilus]|uniref:Coenzyme F420-0:L-glutamate ligase n=1 Tax=Terrabacter aeriphilus TaxID=515662 RepID=A0ABP9JC11_9MICO